MINNMTFKKYYSLFLNSKLYTFCQALFQANVILALRNTPYTHIKTYSITQRGSK